MTASVNRSTTGTAVTTGIVACRNFWGQGNQGDHIDVWDGAQMAHGDPSYMDRSEEVVFWTIA